MGTPPADSTASPAMIDTNDTQPSPVKTPLADDTTVPAAEPDARIQKDLPATQGASPTKLEDPVAPLPYQWISWMVLPLWLAIQ